VSTPTGNSRSPGDPGSSAVHGRPGPDAGPAASAGPDARPVPSAAGGTYRTAAVVLALIVIAALAYGLVQTALKASALFTG